MRFPTMTTRRWMLAVVSITSILAVLVGQRDWLLRMSRRRAEYLDLAAAHEFEATLFGGGRKRVEVIDLRRDARAIFHEAMRDKRNHAARRPWLPVPPDPPEPVEAPRTTRRIPHRPTRHESPQGR
jgi:hypothetical protein